jgi:hypothetical protein
VYVVSSRESLALARPAYVVFPPLIALPVILLVVVHEVTTLRFLVGIGSLTPCTFIMKYELELSPPFFTWISTLAEGAFWVPLTVDPANAETVAAMMMVTTSISITPMIGETPSSPFFLDILFR